MSKVFVAGHSGLVGSAICRKLKIEGIRPVIASRSELDLGDQTAVEQWFAARKVEYVYLAAARVGGIHANDTYPAEFIRDNLVIQTNVIHSAWKNGVRKLLFLGSSCIYPKDASQPLVEESLLTGPLEPTNEWYAIAKISGIKMCQAYRRQYGFDAICLMPTNLYGPGDNFHPENSHVLPALIRRFHEAKQRGSTEVVIWGTGAPRREFMHVDDLADAAVFTMANYSDEQILNVGVGTDITILQLAEIVASVVGYEGKIKTDTGMPDGTPRKLLNIDRMLALGWRAKIDLQEGIRDTYKWFQEHQNKFRT